VLKLVPGPEPASTVLGPSWSGFSRSSWLRWFSRHWRRLQHTLENSTARWGQPLTSSPGKASDKRGWRIAAISAGCSYSSLLGGRNDKLGGESGHYRDRAQWQSPSEVRPRPMRGMNPTSRKPTFRRGYRLPGRMFRHTFGPGGLDCKPIFRLARLNQQVVTCLELLGILSTTITLDDKAAISELYELFCPKIYSYLVYRVNGRSEVAEDLTAEVFVKALRNLHMFEFRDVPFSSWLYRIAHNQVVDYGRRRRDHRTTHLDEVPHLLVERDRLDGCLDRQMAGSRLGRGIRGATSGSLVARGSGPQHCRNRRSARQEPGCCQAASASWSQRAQAGPASEGRHQRRQHCVHRLEPNGRRTRARASRRMP